LSLKDASDLTQRRRLGLRIAKLELSNVVIGILKQCYDWVLKEGRDQIFAARWVLGGIPVVNLRTLSARGILTNVGTSRGGHRAYYLMPDPDGVGQALSALRLV
jgi:hypothetical protein